MSSKRVLIAEDESSLREALALRLTTDGFEVTQAKDGEEAVTHLQTESFDALLLDLLMPKKDGRGVLTDLQSGSLKKPGYILILSNLSKHEGLEDLKNMGVNAFLIKAETSLKTISEHLQSALGTN